MTNAQTGYCEDLVRSWDPDRYILALFAPATAREALWPVFALNAELRHIRHAVSEEITAHVRYAWWEEGLEALSEGTLPRKHPVLEALAPIMLSGRLDPARLRELVSAYRQAHPHWPEAAAESITQIGEALLAAEHPEVLPRYRRIAKRIAEHRVQFGDKRQGWLNFKLLMS